MTPKNKLILTGTSSFLLGIILLLIIFAALGKFSSKLACPAPECPECPDCPDCPDCTSHKGLLTNTYIMSPDDSFTYVTFDGSHETKYGHQKLMDELFAKTGIDSNKYGNTRVCVLFYPGTYKIDAELGFYNSFIGCGNNPEDVIIKGRIQVKDVNGRALTNFYRFLCNMTIEVPENGENIFAVSQAAPVRNVKIIGSLRLSDQGYSSGGNMQNVEVTGNLDTGTQQQYFVANSKIDGDTTSNCWNLTAVATNGISPNDCSGDHTTVIDNFSGYMSSIPRPILQDNGIAIIVPKLVKDSSQMLPTTGTILTAVFVANPSDSAENINRAIQEGFNIIFSPGIYFIDEAIVVNRNDVVLIGIGFATLQPINGTSAIIVNDNVDNVKIASILIDAGQVKSESLIVVGTTPNSSTNLTQPCIFFDVYCRVGGPTETATANTMMTINKQNVVTNGCWLWRADNSKQGTSGGLGPDKAVCQNGLVITGDNVSCFCIAIEHTLDKLIIWNAKDGNITWLQTELNYDQPSSWNEPAMLQTGSGFKGISLGVYCFFNPDFSEDGPKVQTAFLVDVSAKIFSAFTRFLSGHGEIEHVVNGLGPSASSASRGPNWCSFGTEIYCEECA